MGVCKTSIFMKSTISGATRLKGVGRDKEQKDRVSKRSTKVWVWEAGKRGLVFRKIIIVRSNKVEPSSERSYIIFSQWGGVGGASVSLSTLVTSGVSPVALRTHRHWTLDGVSTEAAVLLRGVEYLAGSAPVTCSELEGREGGREKNGKASPRGYTSTHNT